MIPQIVILDGASRPHYYHELRQDLPAEWFVPDDPWQVLAQELRPDLALLSDEFNSEASVVATALKRQGVPVLHVVDGVIEWRNNWENPRSLTPDRGMPLFQPVLSHKIACIGRSQARILESWGNLGRCEVVGVPRFDRLRGRQPRQRPASAPFEILVMTAKCAGFTPDQVAAVEQSLRDLKGWFDAHPRIGETPLQPRWRITSGLEEQIGVENHLNDTTGQELAAVLEQIDAVVTTPSTAMLEAMLQGVPVVLLDYTSSPHYVPAAWSVTAPQHLDRVMPELLSPPASKLLHQETILHDTLECRTPSHPRLVRLASEMIRIGRQCRARREPLDFPRRILHDEQQGHHLPEERFALCELYPEHEVFAQFDRVELQAEIGHLRLELEHLHAKVERYQQRTLLLADVLEQYALLRPAVTQMRRIGRKWIAHRRSRAA